MSGEAFKFTELHLGIPLDNLTAAISIIQTQIMATGSDVNTEVMFGLWNFPTDQMQTAVSLLVPLIGPVEQLRWDTPSAPPQRAPVSPLRESRCRSMPLSLTLSRSCCG